MTTRAKWVALAVATLPILVLTLFPGPVEPTEPLSVFCVVCGWRGASDALLNIALFVPFGLALGALGRGTRTALLIGCAFSIGIELLQFGIPNRSPGLGDVIYNSTGSAVGVLFFTHGRRLLAIDDVGRALRHTRTWGVAGVLLLALQAWLLGPAVPNRDHTLEWTPATEHGVQYGGEVLEVRLDGEAVGPGVVPAGHSIYEGFAEGTTVEVLLRPGTAPGAVVPIVRLRRDEEDNFVIGLDHTDLVVHYRTRGMTLRLDRPFPRWDYVARAWVAMDTVRIRLRGIGGGIEIERAGVTGLPEADAERGPRAFVVPMARGWGFLMFPTWAGRLPGGVLDFTWMLCLALPLGFWGPRRAAVQMAVAWIGALFLIPVAFPLVAGSISGALGVAVALPLGRAAGIIAGNPEPFRWWRPLNTLYDSRLAGGPDDEAPADVSDQRGPDGKAPSAPG